MLVLAGSRAASDGLIAPCFAHRPTLVKFDPGGASWARPQERRELPSEMRRTSADSASAHASESRTTSCAARPGASRPRETRRSKKRARRATSRAPTHAA